MNQSSTSLASINLRNKGLRNTTGSLIKGCVKDATTKLSIGSIPSNYQTIIYDHNSHKAFGCSQKRFYQESKNDLQSTYIPDDNLINQYQPRPNVSHSTKGYGPFIAKQQRTWLPKKCSPGPGRYEYSKTADQTTQKKKRRHRFLHQKENREPQPEVQYPGPAQYCIVQDKSTNNGWKSSFKTKVDRSSYIKNTSAPGPGYYDLLTNPKDKIKGLKQNQNSSQKISPSKFFHMSDKQVKYQVPGPGSYEYQMPNFKPLYERIKISGNFIMTKKDRFNHYPDKFQDISKAEEAPDVNSYNLKSAFDSEQRLLKWPCFMSESKRMVFPNQKKMGPNIVAPKIQNRKNFRFNIKGSWF